MPTNFSRSPQVAAPSMQPADDEPGMTPQQAATTPTPTGSTGGLVPQQGGEWWTKQAAPIQWSADPQQRTQQAMQETDRRWQAHVLEQDPFTFSNAIPATPGELYQHGVQAAHQEYQYQAVQQRQQARTDTEAANSKTLADFMGRGVQHYTDPATGRIVPVVDPQGRTMFHPTDWEESVHPKTGQPVLMKRDQFGQRQFKDMPVVPGLDPTDDKLYFKTPSGETREAGNIADMVASPNYNVAKVALSANKRRVQAVHQQALAPMKELVDQTNEQFKNAQDQRDDMTKQIAQATQLRDENVEDQAAYAGYDATVNQLTQQLGQVNAQIGPKGPLAMTAAAARRHYDIARRQAMLDTYKAQNDEIAARLKAEGKDPASDPAFQSNQQGLRAVQESLGAATGAPAAPTVTPAVAPSPLELSEPANLMKQGQKSVGGVSLDSLAQRYGSGEGPVNPSSLLAINQRVNDIGETLNNPDTKISGKLRKSLQDQKDYLDTLYQQRFARLPKDQQDRITQTIGEQKTSTAGAFGRSVVGQSPGIAGAITGGELGAGAGAFGGPYAPVTVPAGAVIGALVGSIIGDKGARALAQKIAPDAYARFQDLSAKDWDQHTLAVTGGQTAGMLAGFKPSSPSMAVRQLSALTKLAKGQTLTTAEQVAAKALAVQAGLAGGTAVAAPLIQGEKVDPMQALSSAAQMMLFGESRFGGKGKGPAGVPKPGEKPPLTPEQAAAEAEFQRRLNGPDQQPPQTPAEAAEAFKPKGPPSSAAESARVLAPELAEKANTPPPFKSAEESAQALLDAENQRAEENKDASRAEARVQGLIDEISGGDDAVRAKLLAARKGLDTGQYREVLEGLADYKRDPSHNPEDVARDVAAEVKRAANAPVNSDVATQSIEAPAELAAVGEARATPAEDIAAAGQAGSSVAELQGRRMAGTLSPAPATESKEVARSESVSGKPVAQETLDAENQRKYDQAEATRKAREEKGLPPPKPLENLPQIMRRLGRERVNELIGDWNSDAELSEDGSKITQVDDPRSYTGKARASAKEFMSWMAEHPDGQPKPEETTNATPTRQESSEPQHPRAAQRPAVQENVGEPRQEGRPEAGNRNRPEPSAEAAPGAGGVAEARGDGKPGNGAERAREGAGAQGKEAVQPEVKPDENPHDSIATSRTLTEIRSRQPRPVEKLYGPNPTPEQRASQEAKIRDWRREMTKATKLHKETVEKSNEWIREQRDNPTEPPPEPKPPTPESKSNDAGADKPPVATMSRQAKRAELDAAGIKTYNGKPLDEANPAEISNALGKLRQGTLTAEGVKPGTEKRTSDRFIEALQKAKIHKPGELAAATPLSLAHDAALDLAILGIRAGRAVADVIKLAVQRFKARYPGATDEDVSRLTKAIQEAHGTQPEPPPSKPAGDILSTSIQKAAAKIRSIKDNGSVKDAITASRDAVDNAAGTAAAESRSEISEAIARAEPDKKLQGTADDALRFFIEADDGNAAKLKEMRAKVANSTKVDPKWQAKALAAIDYASENGAKLADAAERFRRITGNQLDYEKAVGLPTVEAKNYVPRYQDVEETGMFEPKGGNLSGSQNRKVRTFDTMADSLAAGVDPKSLSSVDSLTNRIRSGNTDAGLKAWHQAFYDMKAPDGAAMAVKPEKVERADGSTYFQAPDGYKLKMNHGEPVAIKKEFSRVYDAMTEPNWFSQNPAGLTAQEINGFAKSAMLAADTFHLGRLALRSSMLNLSNGKIGPRFREGLMLSNHSPAEITRMGESGEIPKADVPRLVENKRILDTLTENGYNVGRVSDALHQELVRRIPVLGGINKFIFDRFQRGAMADAGVMEFRRMKQAHPEMDDAAIAKNVGKELNTLFGSFGRQGLFKSATAQALARFAALAPQWNEGLIKSEVGGAAQLAKFAKDKATGSSATLGIRGRAFLTTAASLFVASQLMNLASRGKPTWENPEESADAKMSGWIPDAIGKSAGFFFNPMGLTAETSHILMKNFERSGNVHDATKAYLRGRESALARMVDTFFTGEDPLGRDIPKDQIWKGIAKAGAPVPISAGSVGRAGKALIGKAQGEDVNTEKFPGEFQKQAMQSFGVRTDAAPSPERRIQNLAHEFNTAHGKEDKGHAEVSDFSDLNAALRRGNASDVKSSIDTLLEKRSAEDLEKYYRQWQNRTYTGSHKNEAQFIGTLNPEQRQQYAKARAERRRLGEAALKAIRAIPAGKRAGPFAPAP